MSSSSFLRFTIL